MGEQLHTNHIHVVNEIDKGSGWNSEDTLIPHTDALITNVLELPIGIRTADCVSVFFYDPNNKAIGIAHAGWKGTVNRIAVKTAQKMTEAFNSNPKDLVVGFGPAIGPCYYAIKEDVIEQVTQAFPNNPELIVRRDSDSFLNLCQANSVQLQEIGIIKENIDESTYCTKDHCNEFFSYRDRMQGGEAGLFIAVISIKK